jgi:hypothetical protein
MEQVCALQGRGTTATTTARGAIISDTTLLPYEMDAGWAT